MRELVEMWRSLPGCERQADGSYWSPLFEVTFFCNDDGVLHRDGDRPAVIWDSGIEQFWTDGELHRPAGGPTHVAPQPARVVRVRLTDDGLAESTSEGVPLRREPVTTTAFSVARTEQVVEAWHVRGKLSRDDGPAQTFADGTRVYYLDGELHRTGGAPAIEYPKPYGALSSGPDEHFVRNRRHRTTGPGRVAARTASGDALGSGEYWIEDHHEPDVRTRYAVLRHYTGEGPLPRLAVDNLDAWEHLQAVGAISRSAERIDPTALTLALRMYPN